MQAQHLNGRRGAQRQWGRWPRLCELCRAWAATSLCADCLARLAPERPRCARCALCTGTAAGHCADCLRSPPAFDRCVTLGDYGFPWAGLITALKFRERVDLAGPLAQALATRLARQDPAPAELVLPVPLSPARLAERGHNQAWELARRVAGALGLAADPHTLQRLRDTAHQVGLGREQRATNLRNAYWVDPARAVRLQGRHIALVDDVLTTGATASAAALTLKQAGARTVQLWVLARTPRPQD